MAVSFDWQVINLWSQSFVHVAMFPQSNLEWEAYVNMRKFQRS